MSLAKIKSDILEEVSTVLSSAFKIDVTTTQTVPHSSDGYITFPNLDLKSQGTKLIETTVLYIDMRRSTELNMRFKRDTVAKLYSAFVRAMTRCANHFGGEVRGIIGDRVMVIFNAANCYTAAVDTAVLMNSVCRYVINKNFKNGEVEFGIGIDYGRMLATKTGIIRRGAAQPSYRSLVWLGRPANIASKLTDLANKPEDTVELTMVRVAYTRGGILQYVDEWPIEFVKCFTHNPLSGLMMHSDTGFHSFVPITKTFVNRSKVPAILMTKRVYDGFRSARPAAQEVTGGWLRPIDVDITGYKEPVYGCDVSYSEFIG